MSSFFAFLQSPGGHVHGLGYAPNVARALNAPFQVSHLRVEEWQMWQKNEVNLRFAGVRAWRKGL
ncbi:MAG TPA: hypothetical protein VLZ84_04055 [Asticcacaulis sp.]|nr:hypothetical protein [Asticcacaulis sp.]